MSHPSVPVFEHLVISYRQSWPRMIIGSIVLPVSHLLVLGLWVGHHVDAQGMLRIGYIDFLGPGLLAATALQVAAGESTGRAFASFMLTRTYHAMFASPLRVTDILAGSIGYVLFRVLISSVGFVAVLTAFGAVHSVWVVAAVPVCVLIGLTTAASAFAYAASISHAAGVPLLMRFVAIPMMLFSGVFFPVDSLPLVAHSLAIASPLWHGVELCRALSLDAPAAWGIGAHTAYLLTWSAAAVWLAHMRFSRRLRG